MTKQEFDKLKCGDTAYVCFRENPPGAIVQKINRTKKTISIFGERKLYHYTKVNKGVPINSYCFWGMVHTGDLVEMFEYND
jgi:hypothetical protein